MSAIGGKADIVAQGSDVRYWSKAPKLPWAAYNLPKLSRWIDCLPARSTATSMAMCAFPI